MFAALVDHLQEVITLQRAAHLLYPCNPSSPSDPSMLGDKYEVPHERILFDPIY